MNGYSWAKTLEIERAGEAVLDAIFGAEFIIVRATREHQKQKIDRFHIHKRDGRKLYAVDYKVDRWAGETGNLALEDVSVRRDYSPAKDNFKGKIVDRGWVHTTIAHYVVFYVPAHDTAYVLRLSAIRERWADIQAGFRLRQTETPGSHVTEFYPVPIIWLRQNLLIERELQAVGAQLRFKFKGLRIT